MEKYVLYLKFCEIYLFGPVNFIKIYVNENHLQMRTPNFRLLEVFRFLQKLYVLDHSGSFDMHIEKL